MTTTLAPSDLLMRKGLGRLQLNSQRIGEALEIYADILRDYPEDIETHLLLGDCYLGGGDAATASDLYTRARRLDPANPMIDRRLLLAQTEQLQRPEALPEPVPTEPEAIARLLQHITGRPAPVKEAEISQAATMLKAIINSPEPGLAVAERLNEIDSLLPALLELNIRQARADGRHDLVETLEQLLQSIYVQLNTQRPAPDSPPLEGTRCAPLASHLPRVLFLSPSDANPTQRHALAAESLRARGCEVVTETSRDFETLKVRRGQCQTVVAAVDRASPNLANALSECKSAGMRIVLDGYVPERGTVTSTLLGLADLICVQNEALVEALRAEGFNAIALPPGWSRQNSLWEQPSPRRHTINLGWIGAPGHVEDVAEIRRPLIRLVRECPQARLVVGGDPQVDRLFDRYRVAESRRLFLPPVSADDYPSLLAEVDISLVPLRDSPSNRRESDLPLMAAGVRRIPWVASPNSANRGWAEGGLFAASPEEWYNQLRRLIMNPAVRRQLGEAGHRKAEEREMAVLGEAWLNAVRSQ